MGLYYVSSTFRMCCIRHISGFDRVLLLLKIKSLDESYGALWYKMLFLYIHEWAFAV
jgi:hypothetical protein